MLIGYTQFDPFVVGLGTLWAVYLLSSSPIRLVGFLPIALSLYFFIPTVTYLTLWQTVPMVLTGWVLMRRKIDLSLLGRPVLAIIAIAFILSGSYAVFAGDDRVRALIRIIYYLGIFAIFLFCYEIGKRPDAYRWLLKGLAVTGMIYAAYGVYQIVGMQFGLPVRGILRGTDGVDMAYEYGFLRINSLANEPKRLGYVLFLGALASVFLAHLQLNKGKFLWLAAFGILATSVFTFAGSYFSALFLFVCAALLIYPSRATLLFVGALIVGAITIITFPELGVYDALEQGYIRRIQEFEVGLDGQRVYRQEFFGEDYLDKNPFTMIHGVGLGQYFATLHREYGTGVGMNELGGLVPMNSNFLELVFDFGGIIALFFYTAIAVLIWKLRRASEHFLCLALLFVTMQSLVILTMPFMVLFAGLGTARLVVLRRARKHRSHLPSFRPVNGQRQNAYRRPSL
jgi:hypothetical protein